MFSKDVVIFKVKNFIYKNKEAQVISRCKNTKYKELYESIIFNYQFLNVTNLLSCAIYCILNDINEQPKCKCCSNLVDFNQPLEGFRIYCSNKCRANDKDWINQSQQTYAKNHNGCLTWSQTEIGKKSISTESKRQYQLYPERFIENGKLGAESCKLKYKYNTGWNEKGITTRIKNGNLLLPKYKNDFLRYRKLCIDYTKLNDLSNIENIEKRSSHANNKDAYHLDHIVSIFDGFKNNIPPYIIGSIFNLRCIHWKENTSKGPRSDIDINTLCDIYFSNFKNISSLYSASNKPLVTKLLRNSFNRVS